MLLEALDDAYDLSLPLLLVLVLAVALQGSVEVVTIMVHVIVPCIIEGRCHYATVAAISVLISRAVNEMSILDIS